MERGSNDPKPANLADNQTKVIAQRVPYIAELEAGKTVYYCVCGRSSSQPYCDGKHQGTAFSPVAYTPKTTCQRYFCGCKATKNEPMCDGAHWALQW